VDLYIQSPIRLHGVVLNFLSAGTTLLFTRTPGGARGSVVGLGSVLQVGRSQVRFPMKSLAILIYLILPAAPWPWGRLSL
jgi:hypothetical protein